MIKVNFSKLLKLPRSVVNQARIVYKRNILLIYVPFTLFIFLNSSYLFAGDATLLWNAPKTNVDGSKLTDLYGYKIYYGTKSRYDLPFTGYESSYELVGDSASASCRVISPNTTECTYPVSGLSPGKTYYFAVTAKDISGNESEYSNEVSKMIQSITLTVNGKVITYEDAEDETIRGWGIYDNEPAGAKIANVYDSDRKNRVVQLTGSGWHTGYVLRKDDGSIWNNSNQLTIEWSMKYSEYFYVYLDVETTAGHRYIFYTPDDHNGLGTGEYVHHGLGRGVIDGKWHTFARDLQADIQDAQPGVTILTVNGFLIRGSGRVDDIKLRYVSTIIYTPTIYEDAEDETIRGWGIYDNEPAGAKIANVYDSDRKNRVVQLTGSGWHNGYVLRKGDGSIWNNSNQLTIEWSMKYSEYFYVYLDVETTAGHRYIFYTPDDYSSLGTGEYVHHGLGSGVIDRKWHTFVRDLQADIQDAQPDVTILTVNGFLIRGSGRVDDISLR